MVVPKIAVHWLFTCFRAARRLKSYGLLHRSPTRSISSLCPSVTKCSLEGREAHTMVCDIQSTLLRSPSLFPFFMLMAFEGGSLLRALLLLLSYPLIWAMGPYNEMGLRAMVFLTFCGLRTKDVGLVARSVLPKFYLENLHLQAYEVLASTGRRVVLTSMPKAMVEGFLREYLGVGEVVGPELQVVKGCYFTGLIRGTSTSALKQKALKDLFGGTKAHVGLVSPSGPHYHHLISHCKEAYLVSTSTSTSSSSRSSAAASAVMPRDRYPKPLIFHDGRLAFFPTPSATLALFLWLPMGAALAIFRTATGLLLPYKVSFFIVALTGWRFRAGGLETNTRDRGQTKDAGKGVLYVCTHRTLLDPVMLSAALQRAVPAVTYSLSRMSEILAPMKTVRLTRDRERDAGTMRRLLRDGDLAVCPEGTTCREPYLLRFSPLFAELAEEMELVAMEASVGMFYGTTASGHKWLDPLVFVMNPTPGYRVEFLGRVPREMTCAGGRRSGAEVANWIQRRLAEALGYECTALTRRDKYLMLAGNEGVVA